TQTLEAMNASVCVGIRGEGSSGDLYGILCVRDERLRDAFSPEEVQLLAGLAAQAAVAVENSRLYRGLKERDRLAALGEMAAGLAHEIRNPLGAIKASAQYLHDDEDDPSAEASPEREFLDIIVEEVDRLNWVVGSFLDYARPSKGDPVPTDVNATVLRTMQLLNAECQAASVTWKSELEEHVPKVRIDVEQLHQVLINLVRNAVQAMETGGDVTLRTRSRDGSGLGGSADHFVEIRVSDTGPGIPQRVLQNLFVPFVTTKDHGTGLGLAISQRIVNAASGEITVSSRAGTGTTFVVKLPVAEETALIAVSAAADELSKAGGQTPSPEGSDGSDGPEPPDGAEGRDGKDGKGDEPAEPAAPSSGAPGPGDGADTARGVATSR
ncbi:MAG: GAF domain-containing protein, partial [Deltaproteobacteria bacterium]|nr:GAF domain-containing protein [Deltaproteobacteria bacterium]